MTRTGDGSAENHSDEDGSSDETTSGQTYINVWQRWRGGADVPFHQYCDFSYTSEENEQIIDTESRDFWLFYTQGYTRQVLRYTPITIFIVVVVFFIIEISTGRYGFVQYVEGTQFEGFFTGAALGIVWLILLLTLLKSADLLPASDFIQAVFIYTVITILLLDMGFWMVETTVALRNDTLDTLGTVFPSGFFLMLFIGGHLVYDGMLRTEHMFSNLYNKEPPIIGPIDPDSESFDSNEGRDEAFQRAQQAYKKCFLADFESSLEDTILESEFLSIRTAVMFSFVFVLPFFITGIVLDVSAASPGAIIRNPLAVIRVGLLSFLAIVNVTVFFQFLVLIKYFHRLLTKHSPYRDERNDGFTLQYQPDHPDGHAGFRDMGQFATRVNTLLLAAGVYTAYRIYTSGLAKLPPDSGGFLTPETVIWAFQFLGPLLVYVVTVVVWIYFSFWQIHKAMQRGRERRIDRELEDKQDGELPDGKRDFTQAPIWPLSINKFIGLLIGDMVPLLSLLPLLQP